MSTTALESIIQAIPDLVFRFNHKGDFLYYYVTKNKLLAVPPDQISGKNLSDLFDPKIVSDAMDCITRALAQKEETCFEYSLSLADSVHYFEARMVPTQNQEVISFIRDITDTHLLQNKNNELVKINQELDSFIYRASHDLRAPLSSILGLAEIGLRATDIDETKSCLAMIKERVQVQDQVIHDIISYARNLRTDIVKEKFNLKLLVFEIIDTLLFNEGAEKIDFQIHIADDFEITADKTRMNVVLSNLVSNAIKYHDSTKSEPYVRINASMVNSKLKMSIEDNGIGIAEVLHSKIFNMFYRASEKSKGSGLGLFIVKDTLQKQGGSIDFTSEHGFGSCFNFSIPVEKF